MGWAFRAVAEVSAFFTNVLTPRVKDDSGFLPQMTVVFSILFDAHICGFASMGVMRKARPWIPP